MSSRGDPGLGRPKTRKESMALIPCLDNPLDVLRLSLSA